ncbi:MAG: glycosyl hydrolase family 8 [Kineosporiaceae bacterium]
MRTAVKLATAAVSVMAVLSASCSAQAAQSKAKPVTGSTGPYPNLFAEAGISAKAVDKKIAATWNQFVHGSPGSDSTHKDGQAIYYQLTDDTAYVEDIANQDVRSEGIGYMMMIAVQLDHRHEFDSLWKFAKTKMQLQSGSTKSFFAWHTRTDGTIIDNGIAPDGDQWIAAALVFASGRWGDGSGIYSYGSEARTILRAMWHQSDTGGVDMFDRTTYLPRFSPPGVTTWTDPSYALPAFYEVFAVTMPEDAALWRKAYTAGQGLLQAAYDKTTGLAPCYSTWTGAPQTAPWSTGVDSYGSTFQEDAWRAIANANVDAAWWGKKQWQTDYSNTLQAFFAKQGVKTYVSRYRLDGTPITNGQNTYEPPHAEGLVAMNSTSSITATGKNRKAFVRDLWRTKIPTGYARYYDGLLYLLGLLYDSAQFKVYGPAAAGVGQPAGA